MAYKQKRIENGIKRAALYARVSTEEQAMHGVSLDAQKERLIQYAKEKNIVKKMVAFNNQVSTYVH